MVPITCCCAAPLSWFQVDCHSSAAACGGGDACRGGGSCWLAPQSGCHSSPAERCRNSFRQYWLKGGARQLLHFCAQCDMQARQCYDCKVCILAGALRRHQKEQALMLSASASAPPDRMQCTSLTISTPYDKMAVNCAHCTTGLASVELAERIALLPDQRPHLALPAGAPSRSRRCCYCTLAAVRRCRMPASKIKQRGFPHRPTTYFAS
jgi:hypothetical protein